MKNVKHQVKKLMKKEVDDENVTDINSKLAEKKIAG